MTNGLVALEILIGIVALFALWRLYKSVEPKWGLGKLIEGADGRPSTSKLQWGLWTGVTLFSYSAVTASRFINGEFKAVEDIPKNLLTSMGLSVTTMVAAKGITVGYVRSGQIAKPAPPAATKQQSEVVGQTRADSVQGAAAIFLDDEGAPDLSKVQMIAWTLIAIAVYLFRVVQTVFTTAVAELPDVDTALMVLMGLGQGAYLGKKLTTVSTPRLTGISPSSGPAATAITIAGVSFGDDQGSSALMIDGTGFDGIPTSWKDTEIKFTFPREQGNGQPWAKGHRVSIGVIVGGTESANTLPFTVTFRRPQLTGLSPSSGPAGTTTITVAGMSFGDIQGDSILTIDGTPLVGIPTSWKDTEIKFTLPATQPNGQAWGQAQRIAIRITVGGTAKKPCLSQSRRHVVNWDESLMRLVLLKERKNDPVPWKWGCAV